MSRIHLQNLLLTKIVLRGRVAAGLLIGLGARDPLHVARVAKLVGNERHGRLHQPSRHSHTLNPVLEGHFLHPINQRLIALLQLLQSFLCLLRLVYVEALFGHVLKSLAVELGQRLHAVLVYGVGQIEDFVSFGEQTLHKW
ncbi:hypothetical protein BpHYR1_015345 [Brachionus plicatilis]|uniref:Uncharacterized protein n=1 Tax=Brachionus plicatilis TaxID=10195 RepID=A0A3M7T582_BRAPC|nr:hypothetical protein BpHYR1_015345 [Brachionus plicatilis]